MSPIATYRTYPKISCDIMTGVNDISIWTEDKREASKTGENVNLREFFFFQRRREVSYQSVNLNVMTDKISNTCIDNFSCFKISNRKPGFF